VSLNLPEKTPFWVRCNDCSYEWIAFYTPIQLSLISRFGDTCCPMCAGKNVFCGKKPEAK
jgi:hypothetical protein